MTGKKQDELRAARPAVLRALSILAAVAALAVSAAPVASAGTSKKPPSTFIEIGTTETLDMNARPTAKVRAGGAAANRTKGIVTDNKDPDR